jgi:excisionase family DNA binding protein
MDVRWLSVEEIARHLGVSRDTVYKWIERKNLPGHKIGRLWKFSVQEVDDWVRAGHAGEGTDDPSKDEQTPDDGGKST